MPLEPVERLAAKRQKPSDQRLQQQPAVNGLLNSKGGYDDPTSAINPNFHTKTEFHRTSNHTDNRTGLPGSQTGFNFTHKLCSVSDGPVSQVREQEPKASSLQPSQLDPAGPEQQNTNSQHRKKKTKKHKDKERERLKDDQGPGWLKTSPDLKQNTDKLDSKAPYF